MNIASSSPIIPFSLARPKSVPFLRAIGESHGFETTNWNPDNVANKVAASVASAKGQCPLDERLYLFEVLSHLGEDAFPVGSSLLLSRHGTPQSPHHAYVKDPAPSLRFFQETQGPAELGAMLMHADLIGRKAAGSADGLVSFMVDGVLQVASVGKGRGKVGSWARFFFSGIEGMRKNFEGRHCLAEMLPPYRRDDHGRPTNDFYESLRGRHTPDIPFSEADRVSVEDPRWLSEHVPPHLKTDDLTPEAWAMAGQVGGPSSPAAALLRQQGFRENGHIDPLDGGPHLIAAFQEIPIFQGVRGALLADPVSPTDSLAMYGFLGVFQPESDWPFRGCVAPFHLNPHGEVTTRHDILEWMRVGKNDRVYYSPMNGLPNGHSVPAAL